MNPRVARIIRNNHPTTTVHCQSCGERVAFGQCEGCGRTTNRPRVATPEELAEMCGDPR